MQRLQGATNLQDVHYETPTQRTAWCCDPAYQLHTVHLGSSWTYCATQNVEKLLGIGQCSQHEELAGTRIVSYLLKLLRAQLCVCDLALLV